MLPWAISWSHFCPLGVTINRDRRVQPTNATLTPVHSPATHTSSPNEGAKTNVFRFCPAAMHAAAAACVAAIATFLACSVTAHPQCLDSDPPFDGPNNQLCKAYEEFGCCTAADNLAIFQGLAQWEGKVSPKCLKKMTEVACTRCDPWAAHIYDGTSDPDNLPGLCPGFCDEFYEECKDTLPFPIVPGETALLKEQDKAAFCARYVGDDVGCVFLSVRRAHSTGCSAGDATCTSRSVASLNPGVAGWTHALAAIAIRRCRRQRVGRTRMHSKATLTASASAPTPRESLHRSGRASVRSMPLLRLGRTLEAVAWVPISHGFVPAPFSGDPR